MAAAVLAAAADGEYTSPTSFMAALRAGVAGMVPGRLAKREMYDGGGALQ